MFEISLVINKSNFTCFSKYFKFKEVRKHNHTTAWDLFGVANAIIS